MVAFCIMKVIMTKTYSAIVGHLLEKMLQTVVSRLQELSGNERHRAVHVTKTFSFNVDWNCTSP